jgi:ribosomal protein S18 acetylase RimI-like enzyme
LAVEVRPARAADSEALMRIDRATWSWLSSPAPRPADELPFFHERVQTKDVLVAEVDGEVAGYVKLTHPTPLPASRHVIRINGIAVSPEFQRRGVGRALLAAAADEARRRGARKLTLGVFGPNEAARKLYESCGFRVEGIQREEFFVEGRYVDDILMALDLSSVAE